MGYYDPRKSRKCFQYVNESPDILERASSLLSLWETCHRNRRLLNPQREMDPKANGGLHPTCASFEYCSADDGKRSPATWS